MSRRRRAVLLLGLALTLGGLAAADVARREAALDRRLGPAVPVVAARTALAPGDRVTPDRLVVRRVPARYAPAGAYGALGEAVGLRVATAIPAGAYVTPGAVGGGSGGAAAGPALRPGERVADLTAAGPADLMPSGSRDPSHGGAGTALALEDVEVLAAAPAEPGEANGAGAGIPRVRASLRVTVRQAVFLAAAQAFAREVRLLPRAPGDDRRGAAGLAVGADLAQ